MAKYEDFQEYIQTLYYEQDRNIENAAVQRYNATLETATRMCPEQITEIFLADGAYDRGIYKKTLGYLYIFSPSYIVCPPKGGGNHKLFPIKNRIMTVEMICEPRDLLLRLEGEPQLRPDRHYMVVDLATDIADIRLVSSSNQCRKLLEIYDTYIKPNVSLEPCILLSQRAANNHREIEPNEVGVGPLNKRGRSPNDDRSDSLNPNNPASKASSDNRSNQMNPNNPAYGSSRGGK